MPQDELDLLLAAHEMAVAAANQNDDALLRVARRTFEEHNNFRAVAAAGSYFAMLARRFSSAGGPPLPQLVDDMATFQLVSSDDENGTPLLGPEVDRVLVDHTVEFLRVMALTTDGQAQIDAAANFTGRFGIASLLAVAHLTGIVACGLASHTRPPGGVQQIFDKALRAIQTQLS